MSYRYFKGFYYKRYWLMIDTFYLTGITNWWTCQYSHHESVSRYLIFFWDVPGASWYCALKPSGSTRGVMVLKWLSCFINKEIINEISFFRIWLFINDYDLITIWNITLLYQENLCKKQIVIFNKKNVLDNILMILFLRKYFSPYGLGDISYNCNTVPSAKSLHEHLMIMFPERTF